MAPFHSPGRSSALSSRPSLDLRAMNTAAGSTKRAGRTAGRASRARAQARTTGLKCVAAAKTARCAAIGRIDLRGLDDLRGSRAVGAAHPERSAAGLAGVAHHAADAQRAVELPPNRGRAAVAAAATSTPSASAREAPRAPRRRPRAARPSTAAAQMADELARCSATSMAGQQLLPVHRRRRADASGSDVVDVLDEHHVAVAAPSRLLDQRAVPAGPEEQRARRRRGTAGSSRSTAIVSVERLLGARSRPRSAPRSAARSARARAPAARVESRRRARARRCSAGAPRRRASRAQRGGLDQVLLERGAAAVGIAVEEQQALRQRGVVEARRRRAARRGSRPSVAGGDGARRGRPPRARIAAAQRVGEGEARQVVDERQHVAPPRRRLRRPALVTRPTIADGRSPRTASSAWNMRRRGARRRHELAATARPPRPAVGAAAPWPPRPPSERRDAVAERARAIEPHRRRRARRTGAICRSTSSDAMPSSASWARSASLVMT